MDTWFVRRPACEPRPRDDLWLSFAYAGRQDHVVDAFVHEGAHHARRVRGAAGRALLAHSESCPGPVADCPSPVAGRYGDRRLVSAPRPPPGRRRMSTDLKRRDVNNHVSHEVLPYESERGFLSGAIPFLRTGAEAGDAVLAISGHVHLGMLRECL